MLLKIVATRWNIRRTDTPSSLEHKSSFLGNMNFRDLWALLKPAGMGSETRPGDGKGVTVLRACGGCLVGPLGGTGWQPRCAPAAWLKSLDALGGAPSLLDSAAVTDTGVYPSNLCRHGVFGPHYYNLCPPNNPRVTQLTQTQQQEVK